MRLRLLDEGGEEMTDAHKRGTVFRFQSDEDAIVRVYKNEPRHVSLDGMRVTTQPISEDVDGVTVTVWVRVIRPE